MRVCLLGWCLWIMDLESWLRHFSHSLMHIMWKISSILGNLLPRSNGMTSSVTCACFNSQNIGLKYKSGRCIYSVATRMAAQYLFWLFQKVLRRIMHCLHTNLVDDKNRETWPSTTIVIMLWKVPHDLWVGLIHVSNGSCLSWSVVVCQ